MAMMAALTACSTEPDGDRFDMIAVLRGTVTDAAGDPVSSANVVATAAHSLPNGNAFDIADSVRTDAFGRCTISLRILNSPDADAADTTIANVVVSP